MSWAVEEWKEGLSTRVLQKIQELESQVDKLKKERQQRQFQLESLEAALQKQKQKVENEKNEGATLKRENQSLMELCDNLEKAKQKISHDLQVKESQVNFQSGQLNSSKKQIERLEQELKRYKSDLEKSQQTLISGDLSFSGTPQKSFTAPFTPIQSHKDPKFEELEEKYNKEVEERKKLEAELRTIQQKINQPYPQSNLSHREIARHQASSSVFSWQQEKTPSRNQETPVRKSSATSCFPWEKETNSNILSEKKETSNSFAENCNSSSLVNQLRAQNQELNSKIKDLEQHLQVLEKEKKTHMNKHQEIQLQLDRMKLELMEKDNILNKNKDEATRLTAQLDQATAQVKMMELKVKKMSEELNCQRQNAESTRCSLEQKIKTKEKEYQEELSCQQRSLQTLDQQCSQIKNKLTQELQQAKNEFRALQAEFDKVTSVKQRLEHDTSDLTQRLCRAEQALLATQAKDTDLTRSFEELKKEKNLLDCQFEKKLREIHQLEEELKTIKQSLKQSQNFAEEMKNKNIFQEAELKLLEEKFKKQDNSLSLEKLKLALADMEKQQAATQDLLKEKENYIKEQKCKISKMEEESGAFQSILAFKERECEELKKEATAFSQWKNESDHLINKLKSEKEGMLSHINDLESSLQSEQIKNNEHSEKLRIMETEKERSAIEIKELRGMLDCRSVQLEAKGNAYDELQQRAEFSDKKYLKEIEIMSCKIFQLTSYVGELEEKLQLAASEGLQRDQCYHGLHGEHERTCCLVKAKGVSKMTEDGEVLIQNNQGEAVFDDKQLPMSNSITEEHRCAKMCLGIEENKDLTVLQDQISSLEVSLVAQKQLNLEQKKQYEDLLQIKGETEKRLVDVEKMHESFVTETKQLISNLQVDISARQDCIEKTFATLEEKEMQLQRLNEKLESGQAEIQDLKINNKLLEDSLRQLKLLSETWSSEKKDMSSMICTYNKEIEKLAEENAALRDLSRTLEQEQITLLEANKSISNSLKEREEIISEMSRKQREEGERIEARSEETKKELIVLQAKYKLMEERNGNMMCILREHRNKLEEKKAESEQEKQVFRENEDILCELIASEETKKRLIQELQQLQLEFSHSQNRPSVELDCLRQEALTVRATQNETQEQYDDTLFQEKEQLVMGLESKSEPVISDCSDERRLNSKQQRKPVGEKDSQLKLELFEMDFEDREPSIENYRLQMMQLETALKIMEEEYEKCKREKEKIQQELLSVKECKTSGSQLTELDEGGHSLEYNYGTVAQNCDRRGMTESCSLLFPELTSGENYHDQLASSLQVTISKLNELEKMYERLQTENLVLTSAFTDSKADSITVINKIAEEEEKIMNADKNLKDERAVFPDELMDQSDNSDRGIYFNDRQVPFKFKECSTGHSSEYEDLKLSSKEVKMHFAEIKEKFFSLQNEHKVLYEQHCAMSSKISELQSCIETLKAENSSLSTSLSDANMDSMRVLLSSSQKDGQLDLVETKPTISFSDLSASPSFIKISQADSSFNSSTYRWPEEINQLNSSEEIILEGAGKVLVENPCNGPTLDSAKEENTVTPGKSNLESRVEELQTLCQTYEKSIKVLEDQFHLQEDRKKDEIQELKQIILSERKEIDYLKQQNRSDNEEWQQKLHNLSMEMECKLAAERKQSENLYLELEAARFQLQVLDLSSRSLLCTDTEVNPQQENNSFYELRMPNENKAQKNDTPERSPYEKMVIRGKSLCENVTETIERGFLEDCTEKLREQECRNVSEEIANVSDCVSVLSFSNSSSFLSAADFSENQISTETNQQTAENLNLINEKEESNKKVDLLMKVKELSLPLDFQHTHLTPQRSAFVELEEMAVLLKKVNCDIKEKLESVSLDKQQLSLRVMSLEKELDNIKSELEIYKARLSNVTETETLDDVEMASKDWHERFIEVENELKRTQSEKENIENHALSIEKDFEVLQSKYHQLERDREIKLETICGLHEHLAAVTTERNHISQELNILSENKKELDKMYQKLQEKLKALESNKTSTEFIRSEDEVMTETNLSDVNQESSENEHQQSLEKVGESFTTDQNQEADLNKEKDLGVRESEMMQSKLSTLEMENSKLYKSLEGLLIEKGELAARLNSAQQEVHQMRYGIEKLKVKIESDEKKKRHIAEKLKESERKADSLLDKIERLERELQMSEENLEDAFIQSETAKEEAETLKIEMGEMTERLKCLKLEIDALSSQKEHLAKNLKEKQDKILEMESSNLATVKILEEKEEENMKIKGEFESAIMLLKAELKDVNEKLEFSCKEQAVARAKEDDLINQVTHLEQDRAVLLQQCEEIKSENTKLEHSKVILVEQVMDCKQKLDEKIQEIGALQKQVEDAKQLSLQLTHMEREHECWHQEKKQLENLITELKLKVQHFSNNENFQDILNALKISYKDLEKELESTLSEKAILCKKVNELTESCTELEIKLCNTEQKIPGLKEEFTVERKKLAEQIQLLQEESESNKIQLHLTISEKNELSNSLEMVQKELQEKECEMIREISEYQDKLHKAEQDHQAALAEVNQKNEVEIQACQDKMNSLEHFVSSQKMEIERLKSNKEELNNFLKEANQTLEELQKNKADSINSIIELKKQNEFANNKVQLWMKSCKQMEQEKEILQKHIVERDELLKKKNLSADGNAIAEETRLKLEELQESVEVKTREADENLEKYCSLIVKYYKLEEANEMLKTQVTLLSGQLKQPTSDAESSPVPSSSASGTVDDHSVKGTRSNEDTTKLSSKRQRNEDSTIANGEPRSPIPEALSKKKRKDDLHQRLLSQENMEYEVDGLPEVVKKGFADIPTEKVSPYILRRTTLNVRTDPHQASQSKKLSSPTQDVKKRKSDYPGERSHSTAGGSKSQKVTEEQQSQGGTVLPLMNSTPRSPLCTKAVSDNTPESNMVHKAKNTLNAHVPPEQHEQENCKVQ
ncbi:centromere protein F isoform X2 [Nothoprocta perdicaria]|uniref:centromere protein F isoform X2 n=1 Tax=Nothoprocta perdicaria TaxID=30464 RepID=UPI000E1BCB6C|nr:centromere protein F isoform X2 [Nothoprocta perdicaria]